ncbi:MAG: hypothetical protein ACK4FG_00970 [Brevundimonas sp.]
MTDTSTVLGGLAFGRHAGSERWGLFLQKALFILTFVLYYLEISASTGGGTILLFPNVGSFLTGTLLIVLNRWRIRPAYFQILMIIVGVLLASVVLTSTQDDLFVKRLRSTFQISAALFSAYGAFLSAAALGRSFLARFFGWLFVVLIVGSVAESQLSWFRGISDAARAVFYPETTLYAADVRDLTLYGAVRPRLFGREPSLVGINAGFALTMWSLTTSQSKAWIRVGLLAVGVAVGLVIVRSPTILFFGVAGLAGELLVRNAAGAFDMFRRFVVIAILAFVVGAPIVIDVLNQLTGGQFDRIVLGTSFFIRMTGPFELARAVISERPWFGVGIGGFDALLAYREMAYADLSSWGLAMTESNSDDMRKTISNAFWEYWMFLGLFGGAVVVYLLNMCLKNIGLINTVFPFLALALAAQNVGGSVTFRIWYFFLLWAAAVMTVERMNRQDSICARAPSATQVG